MYKFPAGKLNIEVMCCFYPFYSHAVKTLSGKASEFMFLLSFSCAVKSNIYDWVYLYYTDNIVITSWTTLHSDTKALPTQNNRVMKKILHSDFKVFSFFCHILWQNAHLKEALKRYLCDKCVLTSIRLKLFKVFSVLHLPGFNLYLNLCRFHRPLYHTHNHTMFVWRDFFPGKGRISCAGTRNVKGQWGGVVMAEEWRFSPSLQHYLLFC